MKNQKILLKFARITSELFNGFFTMILTPSIAFALAPISVQYKIIFPLAYLLVTLFPYIILKRLGRVSDYEFTKREERPPYFTMVTIGYLALFILTTLFKDSTLSHITLNIFTATCILTMVNLYWKMSGHMTYSTVLFFSLIFLFPHITWLPYLFIATPFIAISRVILKKHTVAQVVTGTLVSSLISILILWIL